MPPYRNVWLNAGKALNLAPYIRDGVSRECVDGNLGSCRKSYGECEGIRLMGVFFACHGRASETWETGHVEELRSCVRQW